MQEQNKPLTIDQPFIYLYSLTMFFWGFRRAGNVISLVAVDLHISEWMLHLGTDLNPVYWPHAGFKQKAPIMSTMVGFHRTNYAL